MSAEDDVKVKAGPLHWQTPDPTVRSGYTRTFRVSSNMDEAGVRASVGISAGALFRNGMVRLFITVISVEMDGEWCGHLTICGRARNGSPVVVRYDPDDKHGRVYYYPSQR